MMNRDDFPNLTIIEHPVIQDRLSLMRQVSTSNAVFKKALREIAHLMTFRITEDLGQVTQDIETPIEQASAKFLANNDPTIIPILRAGLGLSEGISEILSNAPIGHIGLYRDEETKRPKEYLVKLPPKIKTHNVLLVDPMLATGYSALHAIDILVARGVAIENIKLVVLVAVPEGVKVIADKYPALRIYSAALDRELNDDAYICPGLGDAGDRIFGT